MRFKTANSSLVSGSGRVLPIYRICAYGSRDQAEFVAKIKQIRIYARGGTVEQQLANLKASNDYARIVREVQEQIEEENREALKELERATVRKVPLMKHIA